MMDWQAERDTFEGRFGPCYESDPIRPRDDVSDEVDFLDEVAPVAPPPPRLFCLTFWRPEPAGGPVTYASLGAADGGPGNEVFLTAAVPYEPFESAVKALAVSAPRDLKPLGVVHHEMSLTSFDALLVAPLEDGTFALGERDGVTCWALRLVPITPAERRLAARDPAALLARLRGAGALVADPLRACVVAPDGDGARRANAVELLDNLRRRLPSSLKRHQQLVALGAPEQILEPTGKSVARMRALLAHVELAVPAILPEPDAPELLGPKALGDRFGVLFGEILGASVDPYAGLVPPRVAQLFKAFLMLVLTTHPLVHPILYEAATGAGRRPANRAWSDALVIELLVEDVAAKLAVAFPSTSERRITARATEAAAQAQSTFVADSELSPRVHAWLEVVAAACKEAADLGPAQGPAADRAIRDAGYVAADVDLDPQLASAPARTRLARLASELSRSLYRDYLRAVRHTLEERPVRG